MRGLMQDGICDRCHKKISDNELTIAYPKDSKWVETNGKQGTPEFHLCGSCAYTFCTADSKDPPVPRLTGKESMEDIRHLRANYVREYLGLPPEEVIENER